MVVLLSINDQMFRLKETHDMFGASMGKLKKIKIKKSFI